MGITATTAPMANTRNRTEIRPTGRIALAAIFLIGALTMVLAFPRLVSGVFVALAPGLYERPHLPDAEQAAETVAYLQRAQGWVWTADVAAYQAQTMRVGKIPGEDSILIELLARAPLRPESWLLLATLHASQGRSEQAIAAWRSSVYAGRVEPPIMPQRAELGLSLRATMSQGDLKLLEEQVRLSFVLRPAHLVLRMNMAKNADHMNYYRSIVDGLSSTEIDHMVRIHALH
jgi:hypothetical protein